MLDIEKRRAQKRAYDEKRANQPTFPKTRLDDDRARKLEKLTAHYGSKKAVLTAGIDILYENLEKAENKY